MAKRNAEEIRRLRMDANVAKHRLIEIMYSLEEAGAIREAKSLGTIIWKLEVWQNK